METVLEAIERLQAAGYEMEMSAAPGGRLRCGVCHDDLDPHTAVIEETVRFEGASDPDDEAIVLAISTPHGHLGHLVAAYGPDMSADEVSLLQALTTR